MGLPLPPPQVQFIDADGDPYTGGTVETYVVGTTTPKNTWQDEAESILNPNPIVLDAAGRAIIWGTGDYRFIVRDVTGQLVYDGVTSVVDTSGFATTADITAAVQTETDRAEAAEATLTTNLNAEVTRAEAAENTLTYDLNNEIARAKAAETTLQDNINAITGTGAVLTFQAGQGTTNTSGALVVTFSPAFTSYCSAMVACAMGPNWAGEISVGALSATGGTVYSYQDTGGGIPVAGTGVMWIAVGS